MITERLDRRSDVRYVEHCEVAVVDSAVVVRSHVGVDAIPIEVLHMLLLGPGTSITHAAVRAATRAGCGIAFMAANERFVDTTVSPLSNDITLGVRQAAIVSSPSLRLAAARRMLHRRFGVEVPHYASGSRLLGWEGAHMRSVYRKMAERYGVQWVGRTTDLAWDELDTPNLLLSTTAPLLYAAVSVTCAALRLHPDLGIVHTAQPRGFVFDLADIYRIQCLVDPVFQLLGNNAFARSQEAVATVLDALERYYWSTCHDAIQDTLDL